MSNTKAVIMMSWRLDVQATGFADLVLWRVPMRMPECAHSFKQRFAYVVASECVLRYDNERGKGEHRQFAGVESAYVFSTPGQLVTDSWTDVRVWNGWRS